MEQPDPMRTRPDYDFRCDRCGAPHNIDTSIPSVIWNAIMPDGGALCTLCIDDLMAEKGLTGRAEFYFAGKALRSKGYAEHQGDVEKARRDAYEAAALYMHAGCTAPLGSKEPCGECYSCICATGILALAEFPRG